MNGTVETFRGRGKQPYRFRLKGRNGQIIAQSEGYTRLTNARQTARLLAAELGWPLVHRAG